MNKEPRVEVSKNRTTLKYCIDRNVCVKEGIFLKLVTYRGLHVDYLESLSSVAREVDRDINNLARPGKSATTTTTFCTIA